MVQLAYIYIGDVGEAEREVSVTPEAIITDTNTNTNTNRLCLKHGDTQYILKDSSGNVLKDNNDNDFSLGIYKSNYKYGRYCYQ